MTHQIVLLPGDGVGPEVTEEAHRVLEKALLPSGREIGFVEALEAGFRTRDVAGPDDTPCSTRQFSDAVLDRLP